MDQAHFRATAGMRLATRGRSAPTRQRQAQYAHLWVAACLGTALVPLRSVPNMLRIYQISAFFNHLIRVNLVL